LSKGFEGHHFITGLASHFRDLLVCKTPETIELLEVGDQTKTKYLEQSKLTSQEFLFEAITIANDCDLKYKSSKNQRLLVELCLMQLASITFDGEKKKGKYYIIPASYFKKKGITPIPVKKPDSTSEVPKNTEATQEPSIANEPQTETLIVEKPISEVAKKLVEERPKIILNSAQKGSSGLSLSSIKKKKEHLIKQMEVVLDEEDLPKDDFTEAQMKEHWEVFVSDLEKNGKYNLASILRIDTPKLVGTNICLEFPNSTNKVEVERQQYDLLSFLRQKLNNYDISLEITINEEKEKQYAYTPKEKYEKLNKKNPNLDLLRKTFDLDI
jgi:DNA polymerase-3 subunit gamma/tau